MVKIEEILKLLGNDFSELRVAEMLDDEILEWVDSDWEEDLRRDGYSEEDINEYNWYQDYGKGEAEDRVVKRMIKKIESEYNSGRPFNENLRKRLYDEVKGEYCL